MGTSSIFYGNNDKNPLLPDDFDYTESDDNLELNKVKWKTVKSDMSKYINSGGTYSSPSHIIKQYIKASGGAHKMFNSSYAGKKVAKNIGNFFDNVINKGLEATLNSIGVEYIGKSINDIFSNLINILAPDSNTKEDIVAKEATCEALTKIFDYVESNEMDLNCIENMPAELIHESIKEYISSYIWISIMKDLGSRLEIYISNSSDSYNLEKEFKSMISGIVDVEIKNNESMINNDIPSAINFLYERCLSVMEEIV